jgi:arsenate reductase (thioredoxin)
MAAAFFNQLASPRKATAASAGTQPAGRVHPDVVTVMREVGMDLADALPQLLTPALAAGTDWLITMGCGESCPHVPGAKRDDWPVADPKGAPLDRVRAIRDEIRDRVAAFVERQALR